MSLILERLAGLESQTPLGTLSENGNPDSAKMTGTPAQKKSAAKQQTEQEAQQSEQLSFMDRLSRLPFNPSEAALEAKKQVDTQAAALSGLLSPEARNKAMKVTVSDPSINSKLTVLDDSLLSIAADKRDEAKRLLSTLFDPGTDTTAALARLSQTDMLGSAALDPELLKKFFKTDLSPAALQAAIKVEERTAEEVLPADQLAYYAQVLGMQDSNLVKGTKYSDLLVMLEKANPVLGALEKAKAILANPIATEAAKRSARNFLIDIGAAGLSDVEAKQQSLEDQVQQARQFTFGGITKPVSEWLTDASTQDLIKQAINDPAFLEQLKANPNFAPLGEFVEDNKKELADALAKLPTFTKAYDDKQKADAAAKVEAVKTLLPEAAKDGTDPIKAYDELTLGFSEDEKKWFDTDFQQLSKDKAADPIFQAFTGKNATKPEEIAASKLALQKLVQSTPEVRSFLTNTLGKNKDAAQQIFNKYFASPSERSVREFFTAVEAQVVARDQFEYLAVNPERVKIETLFGESGLDLPEVMANLKGLPGSLRGLYTPPNVQGILQGLKGLQKDPATWAANIARGLNGEMSIADSYTKQMEINIRSTNELVNGVLKPYVTALKDSNSSWFSSALDRLLDKKRKSGRGLGSIQSQQEIAKDLVSSMKLKDLSDDKLKQLASFVNQWPGDAVAPINKELDARRNAVAAASAITASATAAAEVKRIADQKQLISSMGMGSSGN